MPQPSCPTPRLTGVCLAALTTLFVATPGPVLATPQQAIAVENGPTTIGAKWSRRVVSVRYSRSPTALLSGGQVQVVMRLKNVSPLPLPTLGGGGLRIVLNGRTTYAPASLNWDRTGMVARNGEVTLTATFNVPADHQGEVTSIQVTEPDPRAPMREAQGGVLLLPRLPAPPPPPAAPLPAPPVLSTPPIKPFEDSGIQAFPGSPDFSPLGQWRVRINRVVYGSANPRDGHGTGLTRFEATLQNTTSSPLRLRSAWIRGVVTEEGGRATANGYDARVGFNGRNYLGQDEITVPPGGYVELDLTSYLADAAAQRLARRWTLTLSAPDASPASFSLDLPRFTKADPPRNNTPPPAPAPPPPAPPPPPPVLTPPAEPAPNRPAEAAMRALEGDYVYNGSGRLSLSYQDGLLIGEVRTDQPGPDRVKLTLSPQGRLVGVMQRAGQSADTTWFAVDLTPSFDGTRLEGSAAYVHRPTNSPMPFSARRESPPQPAPSPTPQGGSVAGTGDYRPTAYLDMRIDRVGRTADGSVEVILAARNSSGERKGVQHDTQRFALIGSDGFEYGWDGNFYGQSGAEHLNETIWLQPQAQSRVTYVFPRVPADVTPARLILRENGAQSVVFELPR